MYVYQNGKLYRQVDGKLVGVEIYSDKILLVDNSNPVMEDDSLILTPQEVRCKFQIENIPKGEVVENDTVRTPKRTPRKSNSK